MKMGVVADDLTGAHDIGSMFAKAGYVSDVFMFDGHWNPTDADVCILDTNARLDDARAAYDRVFAATRELQRAGCPQFFNKTSSAFVGNVGAYFDGMLDALGESFALVVVGFPKNGRITREGVHFVHGEKLDESEFRHDPLHPMTRSNLVEILQAQTTRRVGLIHWEIIVQGANELRAKIARMKSRCNYLVLDVVDQAALATIARAVHDECVLCGSSALAEELAVVWGTRAGDQPHIAIPSRHEMGVLCVAGSLMPQTIEQIEHLKEKGTATWELNTRSLFEPHARENEIERLANALAARLQNAEDTLLHSPNSVALVERTRAEGAARGLSRTKVSRRVTEALAEITARTRQRVGTNRLIVAGGETSAAVCARLGIKAMRVWKEIQPGLPSCIALTNPPLLLVLKSGSFGTPDFFEVAIRHLEGEQSSFVVASSRHAS